MYNWTQISLKQCLSPVKIGKKQFKSLVTSISMQNEIARNICSDSYYLDLLTTR